MECKRAERQKETGLFLRLAASKDKDELLVKYAIYGMDKNLFVQKYQLYLPNEEELRREVEATLSEQRESLKDRQ